MPFKCNRLFRFSFQSFLKFAVEKWFLNWTPRCPESIGQKRSTAKSSRTVGCERPMELSAIPQFSVGLSSFEVRQKNQHNVMVVSERETMRAARQCCACKPNFGFFSLFFFNDLNEILCCYAIILHQFFNIYM